MATLTIQTFEQRQVLDITQQIQEHTMVEEGSIVLQLLHTTAALTTADLDPGTDKDMLEAFWDMVPQPPGGFRHPHDPEHAPAHLLASLIGPSLNLVVMKGEYNSVHGNASYSSNSMGQKVATLSCANW